MDAAWQAGCGLLLVLLLLLLQPVKLDCSVDLPPTLDLSSLKAKGLLPGEQLLPEREEPQGEVRLFLLLPQFRDEYLVNRTSVTPVHFWPKGRTKL